MLVRTPSLRIAEASCRPLEKQASRTEEGLSMHLRWLTLCLLSLFLVGCGAVADQAGSASSTTIGDQAGPPPITLADTPPAALDVRAGITIGGYAAPTRGTTEIVIDFLARGRLVSFQNGETLACDGAAPTRLATGFDQSYPTPDIAGKIFTCIYTSGKRSATLQFRVPTAPVIVSPAGGSAVPRSTATLIHFQAEGSIEGIVALGSQDKAIAQITAPGVASVDTSHFSPGTGQISLTQFPLVADAAASTFASFQANCTAATSVDIIWS
jgi:hypothetical protein